MVEIQTLTAFFMWSTLLNGGILIFWAMFILFTPDLVYRIQNKWFPMSRDTYNIIIYSFLGLFKLFFIFFNLVPYVALLIIE